MKTKTIPLDKIAAKIAGMGVPALVLMVAINATGLAGAAAITTALCALGPGGMVGGVMTLVVAGVIVDGITEWGFNTLFSAVVHQLCEDGETPESLKRKIRKYPVTKNMKNTLIEQVNRYKYQHRCLRCHN